MKNQINNPRTETGIVGVRGPYRRQRLRQRKTGEFLQHEEYFQATWQEDGQKRKVQISIAKHGKEKALKLAIRARRKGLGL